MSAAYAETSYNGKYKNESWARELIRDLPKLQQSATKTIKQKLGIEPKSGKQITIELRDVRDEIPEEFEIYEGPAFQVVTDKNGDERIIIHMEFLASGRVDHAKLVTHEMVHAVMRTHLDDDAYEKVPGWLREGLAVYVADETEQRTRVLIRRTARDKEFADTIVGLEEAERDVEHYAEFGLAIERIAKTKEDAIQKLAQDLIAGKDAKEIIAEITGESWDDFVAASKKHALDRTRDLKPASYDDYRTVAIADMSRPASAVERYCRDFLKEHSESWCKPNVLYIRGKAARQSEKWSLAERCLESALRKDAADLDFVDDALFQLASCYMESGAPNKADEPAKQLLRDHPTSPHQARALYYLIEAEAAKNNNREARRLIRIYNRSFPKGEDRDKLRSLSRRL